MSFTRIVVAVVLVVYVTSVAAFVPVSREGMLFGSNGSISSKSRSKLNLFDKFFEELDNFIDDATSRRLGAGASFYGKRKSNFYGENDSQKKVRTLFSVESEFEFMCLVFN